MNINEFENINIKEDLEKSFLRYAMSVITSRAIPDARDGLKPVTRRIIYAMAVLGLTHEKAFKKSSRVVGEVIGKYHPHGEQSIYGSLVHIAQDFKMNHTLVNGHGNFGSIDGDEPAAQRYTEVKLTKISSLLLNDIDKNTVNFRENYDGSEKEPVVLPTSFPNLLVNGSFGIAVGMSTKIPPHNLIEISQAIITLVNNENTEDTELLDIIKGPDFPTGGEIDGDSGIKWAYLKGTGKYTLNSKWTIENKKNYLAIIINEIPFNVNKSDIVIKLGELSRNGIITEIRDVKDESNKGKIRLRIVLKNNVDPERFMNKILKKTPLQKKEDINLLALVDNKPKVLTLKEALLVFINYQKEIIIRKTEYELKKAKARLHILEGLVIALENIDEVVRIIKESPNSKEAKGRLCMQFSLTEIQSKAILEMQLQRLTSLEVNKIKNEKNAIKIKIADYIDILENPQRVSAIIIKKQEENIKNFGVPRRTVIREGLIRDISDEELIKDNPVFIGMSTNGYLRRLGYDEFKIQKRGGKGIRGGKFYDDDCAKWIIPTSNKSKLLFLTSKGKVYSLKAYMIHKTAKQSKGIPVSFLIDKLKETKEKITSINAYGQDSKIKYIVFITKKGYIKKVSFDLFRKISRSGKKAITLEENDEVIDFHLVKEEDQVVVATSNNKLVRFKLAEVTLTGRLSRGMRAVKLIDNNHVVASETINSEEDLVLVFNNAKIKKLKAGKIRLAKRNSRGVKATRKSEDIKIIRIFKVTVDDNILITTTKGMVIIMDSGDIRILSRNAIGSKALTVSENDSIVGAIAIKKSEPILDDINNVSHETFIETIDNKENDNE